MSISPTTSYRERIYIIQDIILKLAEYGELNQTAIISFTGLNLKKHRCILDELEVNGLIRKSETPFGKRVVIVYKPTQKGIEFCRSILEPYERMFPRKKESVLTVNNTNTNTDDVSNRNDDMTRPIRKTVGSPEEMEQQQHAELQPAASSK
ncbi:MAG TPA: winged helix-turn-helix domain-containing protein [Nitrososphaeraceae archaeon]|nr:winged helix-turn-helix domain-containing protein [Nitrososphaeraceae archaeon]